MTDYRGHEPMLYAVVKPMDPGEFLEVATRLGDRAYDVLDFGPPHDRKFDPEVQSKSDLLHTLGDVALANVVLAEGDDSPDATAVRMLRAIGKNATWHVERARSVATNLAAVETQLEREPRGPFLLIEEQDGGVAITAGRTNGESEWGTRIWQPSKSADLIPELRIGREPAKGEARSQFLAYEAEARVVTDAHLPSHLIHDWVTNSDTHGRSGRAYGEFLSSHFGADARGWGIDENFPGDVVMIGLGTQGVRNLVREFQRLTGPYYNERPLGRLELQRIIQQANAALEQVTDENILVTSGPHHDLRKSFEEGTNLAFTENGLSEPEEHFEEAISRCIFKGKNLSQDTLTTIIEQVAESMYELHEGTVAHEDLLVAVRAEIDQQIRDAQDRAAPQENH